MKKAEKSISLKFLESNAKNPKAANGTAKVMVFTSHAAAFIKKGFIKNNKAHISPIFSESKMRLTKENIIHAAIDTANACAAISHATVR
jgi:hypothetical protein